MTDSILGPDPDEVSLTDLTDQQQQAVFDAPEIAFSKEGMIEMLKEVAKETELDVHRFEGQPVAEVGKWVASLSASVQAIARALQLDLEGRLQ